MNWLKKIKNSWGRIQTLVTSPRMTPEEKEELFELLIEADVGFETATELTDELEKGFDAKEETERSTHIADRLTQILQPYEASWPLWDGHPSVVLMTGVNGSGKTTTCAKLAQTLQKQGKKPMLVAADLFRAAATEQLALWAERLDIPLETAEQWGTKDAAALVFQAYQKATKNSVDVMIVDTAGRLHHRTDLMDELKKIQRVLQKHNPQAPHLTLFVLDATSGQNGLQQLKTFQETIPIQGLIVSKMDGTAKGGMLFPITRTLKLPIYALGTGETCDALSPFCAQTFCHALMGSHSLSQL